MERDLLLREVGFLKNTTDILSDSLNSLGKMLSVEWYPKGELYGFIKEKSFLRDSDFKTKKLHKGRELYFPNKQMVDVVAKKNNWLLVRGESCYATNGVVFVYSEGNKPVKVEGWVKKTWVDIRQKTATNDTYIGKSIEVKAKIKAPLGIKLHSTPNPATKLVDSVIYAQNADVTIIGLPSIHNDPNWYKIKTLDGKEGWIESRYVVQLQNKYFDSLTKESYVVKEGDMLESLVRMRYPEYNIKTGDDFRTIAHAFSILNDGNPAIYYKGESDSWWRDKVFDRDMARTRQIYASIKLRKGGLIYFPTESYIEYLKDTGKVGQRPDWKNHAIDFGKSVLKFIDGFIDGCQAIIEGIWEDIKSLFSLSFFKDIYRLIKDIIDNPYAFLSSIKEMIGTYWTEIEKFVTSSDNQTKFYGVGKGSGLICGMIVENSINPGARLISLAKMHKLKQISKLIKKIENLPPNSEAFEKVTIRLKKKIETKRLLDIKLVNKWGVKNATEISKAIEARWSLRKSMNLKVGDFRQAHHLIPIESLKNSEVVQKAMIDGGFEINNSINGIPLNRSMHQAAHDSYNKLIQEQIETWATRNRGKFTGQQARDFLEKDLIKWARLQFSGIKELRDYIN